MPQLRGKGYTHWSPPDTLGLIGVLPVPRLFTSKKGASNAITKWQTMPNATRDVRQRYDGFGIDEVEDVKIDSRVKRSRKDLQIEKVTLIFEPEHE